ncbi:nudix hydrolase 3 [Manduca sexta]|uniref:Nudix hydrolase domain-containing protein n=1 Tax=Manduca sexta TaxID=7130 RepID=A0A922CMA2_MANSE|nr:nudix hydrolase 3 [Manduca sexta]KAG6450648.1 hypothetical protein O3G_MSEX006705 [Manduca sexta]
MALASELLLSSVARQRCVSKLKEVPVFVKDWINFKSEAAVLVPLCVQNNEVCLLYTLRSSNLTNHSGQVSFPGGKMDKSETVFETALRETEEEIGVPRESVDIWGKMNKIQGRNRDIIITPVVGLIQNYSFSKLQRNADEVEEIFTVPMSTFCDVNNHASFEYENLMTPVFLGAQHKIWGITGIITHFFLQCFLPSDVYKVDFTRKKYLMDELMPSKL